MTTTASGMEIRQKIASGAAWMVLLKLVERGMGLVSTMVLARLLVPADFGLVAMGTAIIGVLELLGSLGLDVALIQRADARREHYDSAWTFNVCFGALCALVVFVFAEPAAAFYKEPRLVGVMHLLALTSLVGGFGNIGVVNFRRDLEFGREFRFMVARRLINVATTLVLAFTLRSYWALVIGFAVGSALNVALSYYLHTYRPRPSFAALGELFRFSRWLLANNVILFLNARTSDFVIGKLSGAAALGLFRIGSDLANLPTSELSAPINRATFPAYSRLANEPDKLRSTFLDVTAMVALLAVPAGCWLAVTADLFVPVVLGSKWLEAIPIIQIVAFYGVINALQGNIGYVYMATGRPQLVTLVYGLQLIAMLAGLFLLTPAHGALGAAWAFLISALLLIPVHQALVITRLEIALVAYGRRVWRPLLAAALACTLVEVLKPHPAATDGFSVRLLALFGATLLGGAAYVGLVLAFWSISGRPEGSESTALSAIRSALRRLPQAVSLS